MNVVQVFLFKFKMWKIRYNLDFIKQFKEHRQIKRDQKRVAKIIGDIKKGQFKSSIDADYYRDARYKLKIDKTGQKVYLEVNE